MNIRFIRSPYSPYKHLIVNNKGKNWIIELFLPDFEVVDRPADKNDCVHSNNVPSL